MLEDSVGEILDRVEERVGDGGLTVEELRGLGFWDAVAEVKRNPALAERYGDRIGELDRRAFDGPVTMPITFGHLVTLTLIGVAILLTWRGITNPDLLGGLALFVAGSLLATAPHPLTHYAAGRLVGIDFLFYFLNGAIDVEPSIKTDYATYVRASPRERAFMHLAAPVVSVLLTLGIFGIALAAGVSTLPMLLVTGLAGFVLLIESLPFLGVATGDWTWFGMDVRKTDVGRAHRELGYRESGR